MGAALKNKLVHWLRAKLKQAKAKGIVMGLSGGIDSAVVAALAKKAAGKGKLLVLILPCQSSRRDLKDAKLVAEKIGIRTKTIDLSSIYLLLLKKLPLGNRLAMANLKPRLRMAVLYFFANKLNYLVCGTGNKSELMIGYFTKHGDGATDILPIGDLLKRQVRILAKELGLPPRIIKKSPSAGLWRGQTDEREIGFLYDELDDILERLEKRKKQILSVAKVNKVKEMIKHSGHKRQGPAIYYF